MKKLINSKIGILFGSLLLAFSTLTFAGCASNNVPDESNDKNSLNEDPAPAAIYYKDENDYLFYSDDYFRHRASRYNEHLATLSIYMAKYSMNPGGPKSSEDYKWYYEQPNRLLKFWELIGFENPDVNHDYRTQTGFDTIGIGAASRKVKEGDNEFTVIACTVRSGGYFYEWENNVYLGDGSKSNMMHEGWYNAANRVIKFVGEYIKAKQITGQIKLWLSGFSRGGAVMNLTGGLIDNMLGYDDIETRYEIFENVNLKREDVLVYTFEAPQGANLKSTNIEPPRNALYNNIFNIVNPNDLVTKVAMSRFGFTRFGIDKFITTEFFDPKGFELNRKATKALYADRDSTYTWNSDNYTVYNIDWSNIITSVATFTTAAGAIFNWLVLDDATPAIITKDSNKVNYDANIALNIAMDYALDIIGDRQSYCDNFQKFARGLMRYMFSDVPQEEQMTWKGLLVLTALEGLAYDLLPDAEAELEEKLNISEITGVTPQEINFALDIAFHLFIRYPGELISLIYNIGDIFENHSTQLNVHHAQAQDSYYIKRYNDAHPKGHIIKVPYRKNSEVTRFECLDINQGEIHVNGDVPVKMTGDDEGASVINRCDKGYGVGYYNYADCERTEWFVPSCYNFGFGFYEHSIDPWHRVYINEYTYRTNQNYNRTGRTIVDENFNCDAGPFTGSYEIDCDPESTIVSDLTNTTWHFDCPTDKFDKKSVTFETNGQTFNSLEVINQQGEMSTYVALHYDTTTAADGLSFDFSLKWYNNNYRTIHITGGGDVTNQDLIYWLYKNADRID